METKRRGVSHQVKSSQYEVWSKAIIENEQNINPTSSYNTCDPYNEVQPTSRLGVVDL